MMTLITNDVLVDGNFYALREYDSQGRTYKIHYIHPSRIPRGNIKFTTGHEKFPNGSSIPAGELAYRIESGDSYNSIKYEPFYVLRKDMVHIQSSLPDTDHNRGYGIIENAGNSFNFYANSEKYGNKFYENGTNNQTFMSTDQKLGPDVYKRLEGYFEKNPDAPLAEAFKTRILDMGVKPINVAIPLGQLQFVETRAFSIEDIGRWFKVPPELLHSRMGSKGGVADMSQLIPLFVQFGLGPFLDLICSQLREELFPRVSQLMYKLAFEKMYLYGTIINEFSQALRNLFEIGAIDRAKIADMLGFFIDPRDKQNTQRYVPTNLMTTGHSLALETKAETANDLLTQQVRTATLDNDNYVSPVELLEKQAELAPKPDTKDKQDESPDEHNLDKRIRTAKNSLVAVINGLEDHHKRVWNQKNEKYKEDANQFAENWNKWQQDKFIPLVTNILNKDGWDALLPELSTFTDTDDLVSTLTAEGFDAVKKRILS
jgi:HK97 family phage portal protein